MNTLIKQQSCLIKKIESTADGWILHPVSKNKQTVFISKQNYTGKMPPFFKWPFQDLKLEMSYIKDFQVSAKLNGHKLFEIPETDFPQEIKAYMSKWEKVQRQITEEESQIEQKIEQALNSYLSVFPIPQDLENAISQMKIIFRAYLQLHFFSSKPVDKHKARIALSLKLCELAQRIYNRHINENEILGTMEGAFKYNVLKSVTLYPHYSDNIKIIEEANKGNDLVEQALTEYYEVKKAMQEHLPPIKDDLLKRYLNYTVREILSLYAYDNNLLMNPHVKDAWAKRLFTEEADFRKKYKETQMLKFHSFILPEKFSDEQISDFINNYSLR